MFLVAWRYWQDFNLPDHSSIGDGPIPSSKHSRHGFVWPSPEELGGLGVCKAQGFEAQICDVGEYCCWGRLASCKNSLCWLHYMPLATQMLWNSSWIGWFLSVQTRKVCVPSVLVTMSMGWIFACVFVGCLVEPDESCDQHHSIITRWWFEICFYFHPYLGKIFNSTNICIRVQATTQSLFGTKSVDYVFSNFETLKVQFFASWTHSEKRVGRFSYRPKVITAISS